LIHRKIGDIDALFFEGLASVEDGFVLYKGSDDVRPERARGDRGGRGSQDDAKDGVIVGFGAATGEENLLGSSANELGNLLARGLDGSTGVLAEGVDGGGVAEFGREVGKHGIEDFGFDRGGCVVIEVDAVHRFVLTIILDVRAGEEHTRRDENLSLKQYYHYIVIGMSRGNHSLCFRSRCKSGQHWKKEPTVWLTAVAQEIQRGATRP